MEVTSMVGTALPKLPSDRGEAHAEEVNCGRKRPWLRHRRALRSWERSVGLWIFICGVRSAALVKAAFFFGITGAAPIAVLPTRTSQAGDATGGTPRRSCQIAGLEQEPRLSPKAGF